MFQKESREFLDEPSLDEAVDCLANLVHWAHLSGIDSDGFSERAFERLAVWRNRTWERLDDGTWHHIEGPGEGR